jgi:hypothetical protein
MDIRPSNPQRTIEILKTAFTTLEIAKPLNLDTFLQSAPDELQIIAQCKELYYFFSNYYPPQSTELGSAQLELLQIIHQIQRVLQEESASLLSTQTGDIIRKANVSLQALNKSAQSALAKFSRLPREKQCSAALPPDSARGALQSSHKFQQLLAENLEYITASARMHQIIAVVDRGLSRFQRSPAGLKGFLEQSEWYNEEAVSITELDRLFVPFPSEQVAPFACPQDIAVELQVVRRRIITMFSGEFEAYKGRAQTRLQEIVAAGEMMGRVHGTPSQMQRETDKWRWKLAALSDIGELEREYERIPQELLPAPVAPVVILQELERVAALLQALPDEVLGRFNAMVADRLKKIEEIAAEADPTTNAQRLEELRRQLAQLGAIGDLGGNFSLGRRSFVRG